MEAESIYKAYSKKRTYAPLSFQKTDIEENGAEREAKTIMRLAYLLWP
jgi:hypothetical protein